MGTAFTLWLGIGAMTIEKPSYALPPAPTDQCHQINHLSSIDLNTSINIDVYPATTASIPSDHSTYSQL